MKLNSLGRQSDLIFSDFCGENIYKENYIVVKTQSNPTYYWGNYIIFNKAPSAGDLKKWKKIFIKEFDYYTSIEHFAFAWDELNNSIGEIQDFLNEGFKLEKTIVLECINYPLESKSNIDFQIVEISTSSQWEDVTKLQIECAGSEFNNEKFKNFKTAQMQNYRKMSNAGLGSWYGAYANGILIADLGIYHNCIFGRYQNVETKKKYRNLGVCSELVHKSAIMCRDKYCFKKLVIVADEGDQALRVYKKLGFKVVEKQFGLCWYK